MTELGPRGSTPDEELVARAIRGDEDAFASLFRKHYRPLYAFCRRRLAHARDAEDCVQEAFSHAWSSLRRAKQPDDFRPWLFTIAARACSKHDAERTVVTPGFGGENDDDTTLGTVASFEDEVVERMDDWVESALANLAPTDRSIVRLTHDFGLPAGTVARRLGLGQRQVEGSLFRTRRALREELSDPAGVTASPTRVADALILRDVAVQG